MFIYMWLEVRVEKALRGGPRRSCSSSRNQKDISPFVHLRCLFSSCGLGHEKVLEAGPATTENETRASQRVAP